MSEMPKPPRVPLAKPEYFESLAPRTRERIRYEIDRIDKAIEANRAELRKDFRDAKEATLNQERTRLIMEFNSLKEEE